MSTLPLVAIIDDDESVRITTDSLVRSLGCVVHTFASAEQFLQSCRLDDFACILADVQMPGMTGLDLNRSIIDTGHPIPTILVTAYPNDIDRARAMNAGIVCYLGKPLDENLLRECLREVVACEKQS